MTAALSKKLNYQNADSLLSRIARFDQKAVQECVNKYGNLIWALAKQMTGSASEAEKIVPEIFTDVWKSAAFYDSELAEEAVWITMIARRRLSEYCSQKDMRKTITYPQELLVKELKSVQPLH